MGFPLTRASFTWQLRTRTLPLGERTYLMGILNVTPDSFSDGGRFLSRPAAITHGLRLLDQGADMLDIGGESTRPNATPVTPQEEQALILPVINDILAARPNAILAVDTYHATTARIAIEAGAEIVNDVSGLLWDEDMGEVVAGLNSGIVLTHTRGNPQQWATLPPLEPAQVLPTVMQGLRRRLLTARSSGILEDRIVLDPGFGFGKRKEENFTLHALLPQLHTFGVPLLVGTSRKSFLGKTAQQRLDLTVTARGPNQHTHATTASTTAAILAGAHILRVHDIPPAIEAAAIADAILAAALRVSSPQPDDPLEYPPNRTIQ